MKPQIQTDRMLVDAALRNSNDYKVIMDMYAARLTRFALRLGASSLSEAEDIVQETFLTAWRYLHDYDSNYTFQGWIYRIARQKSYQAFRVKRRQVHGHIVPEDQKQLDSLADELSLPQEIDTILLRERVQEAVAHLSEDQRTIVTLRYFEDMEYETISDVIKKPVGTVSTLLHRAKEQLKKHLSRTLS